MSPAAGPRAGSATRRGGSLAGRLPDFPWDTLAGARARAAAHPDGLVDLSVGTPVDPTPAMAKDALAAAADSPGYPLTSGTPTLRQAMADYLTRRWSACGATGNSVITPDATLPLIGSKEFVAWLPALLGLGPDDIVVFPRTAYPTYAAGAAIAGCRSLAVDELESLSERPALVWLNSPSNPTGEIVTPDVLAARVAWARDRGAVVASDECYGEFGWDAEPTSVLNPTINGGSLDRLLAVHSLSKRSNLAGYRAGFVAGDPPLISELLEVRKHAGMMVPGPVQAVMVAVLGDQGHVEQQRRRYLNRRAILRPALQAAGFRIEHSEGSLYLWATRGESGRRSIDFLAGRGILVAPGDFYGPDADEFVRVALTATDERVAAAAERLRAPASQRRNA